MRHRLTWFEDQTLLSNVPPEVPQDTPALEPSAPTNRHGVDDRVVNEVCDNCGSPLVVVRSREGRFCTSECAEAFELS